MLHIIRGRAGSGKSDSIKTIISGLINKKESPLLIVPEQFSFETERDYLKTLGAASMKKLTVTSFSRLSVNELKKNGIITKPFVTDGIKNVLMCEALEALEGRLTVFGKLKYGDRGVRSLTEIMAELKLCCITPDELSAACDKTDMLLLKDKLAELALIFETFDALVAQSYFDDGDAVTVFECFAAETHYFKGKIVFLDAFRAFSKQELLLIATAMRDAEDVYITFCNDDNQYADSPFKFLDDFENRIRSAAKQNDVSIAEPEYCRGNYFTGDIAAVESGIYSEEQETVSETDNTVVIAQCGSVDEECTFAATEIRRLLREEHFRCRDIAVIERTGDTYRRSVIDALRRFDIPVFDDVRRPLSGAALIQFVTSVLDCISLNFKTESVLSYIKSALSPLTVTEASTLENYAVVWAVNKSGWLNDFTMHPDGFGSEMDEKSEKKLAYINDLRKKAIIPLVKLKKASEEKSGKELSEKLYEFLRSTGVDDRLFDYCTELKNGGFPAEAERQEKTWDSLMQIIDTVAGLSDARIMKPERFAVIFNMLVSDFDTGEIPAGLDEVTVGSADRIRTQHLKAVFLVGVNKDEFPLVKIPGGILTDSERRTLSDIGLEVKPPFESSLSEERFIAYCALTAASEKLYLTYKTFSEADGEVYPSEIITDIERIIPSVRVIKYSELPLSARIENDDSAFRALALMFNENTVERASLYKYFSEKKDYAGRLSAMERINGSEEFKFTDKSISQKLFGEKLHLSASRVESFYRCPFSYFMRYGLYLNPVGEATLDPASSGTIIHYIFEKVLSSYKGQAFSDISSEELSALVDKLLREYLEARMGGFQDKSKRFMFLYNLILETVMAVFERLKAEFSVSDFKPNDFELEIGGEAVPAYTLPLESGEIKIVGSVDRVDLMEKDGITYLRVIDYKTGKKDFRLSDLFDGLNIQMVLYLMALEKNGVDYYGKIVPAGVIYLPSRIGVSGYLSTRNPSPESIDAQKIQSGKLIGMMLNSDVVVNGSGAQKMPGYLPVSYTKKGEISGKCYSLKQFKALSEKIDGEIINMGEKLHRGEIEAVPYGDQKGAGPCVYCDYRSVCGYEDGDTLRELSALSHTKALEVLDGECDE